MFQVFLLLGKHELAIGTATMAVEMSDDDVTRASSHHCRARVNTSIYMRVRKQLVKALCTPLVVAKDTIFHKFSILCNFRSLSYGSKIV